MVGRTENRVTYPEFYRKDNGDLVFLYRDGSSGNGDLLMNYYEFKSKKWRRVQSNLIDGEGERNAYWQIYDLPINMQNAEYVREISQNSNLINTTSITADESGNPFIATYYKSEEDVATQFKVFYKSEGKWHSSTVSERTTDFKLGGGGTRSVPISRPQIFMRQKDNIAFLHLIYRDQEFNNNVCLASSQLHDVLEWDISTIDGSDMSRWEPTYDTHLWEQSQLLHIYHQVTHQGSGEKAVASPATWVSVLEVTFD